MMTHHLAAILETSSAIDKQRVDEARHRRDLDLKFKAMLREVIWQLIMLLLFTWVTVGGLDDHVFYQNQDIKNVFVHNSQCPYLKTSGECNVSGLVCVLFVYCL